MFIKLTFIKKYIPINTFYLINSLIIAFFIIPTNAFGNLKKFEDSEEIHKPIKDEIIWEKVNSKEALKLEQSNEDILNENYEIIWEKVNSKEAFKLEQSKENVQKKKAEFELKKKLTSINSLNRSIIFNNQHIGPDISWIVPLGFKWNNKYKFDLTTRGHNTRIPEPKNKNFFGWNDGDAVGLISYQFLNNKNSSFGINFGVRSVYQGNNAMGGGSSIGEGLSGGFRWDYALSKKSGFAFGAEQLIHFDGLTDTGRNIYLTFSKAWWDSSYRNIDNFPLYIATAGLGTGRMAVGTVKGFCSDQLGGSGTELVHRRNLCWSPIFSLAKVWNKKYSTFFEYNSRFFLLGSSIAPIQKVPLRGTFALILSDHVDNYKLHDFSELNWVFNISIGF